MTSGVLKMNFMSAVSAHASMNSRRMAGRWAMPNDGVQLKAILARPSRRCRPLTRSASISSRARAFSYTSRPASVGRSVLPVRSSSAQPY